MCAVPTVTPTNWHNRYGYGSVGFNFLISAFTIQWSMLVLGFWHAAYSGDWSHKITLGITNLITGDFAAGAVMISFGAVLGKVWALNSCAAVRSPCKCAHRSAPPSFW